MKSIKNLTTKKLIALITGFALLIATAAGILLGTHRNAFAKLTDTGREDTQTFAQYSPQTVTDDGVENNGYIIFNCDRPFDDIPTYKKLDYKFVTVTLTFQMREIYDGYQHIYLYSGLNGGEVSGVKLNYYGNKKHDEFETVTVEFVSLWLNDFAPGNGPMNLCIRFDASGVGKDNWQYQNMKVTVEVSQIVARTATEIIYPYDNN